MANHHGDSDLTWEGFTTWWSGRPAPAKLLMWISVFCFFMSAYKVSTSFNASDIDNLSVSTALRDAKKETIEAVVIDRGLRYTGTCPSNVGIQLQNPGLSDCSVNDQVDGLCMRSTAIDSLFMPPWEAHADQRRLRAHGFHRSGHGGSSCVDHVLPWLVVRFKHGEETFERCAKYLGIDVNDWPLDTRMAAAKQRIQPYRIGKHLKIWTTATKSHCIVGYGSSDLVSQKVDWLWSVKKQSRFTLVGSTVLACITLGASLLCGLCSDSFTPSNWNASSAQKYSSVPTNPHSTGSADVAQE